MRTRIIVSTVILLLVVGLVLIWQAGRGNTQGVLPVQPEEAALKEDGGEGTSTAEASTGELSRLAVAPEAEVRETFSVPSLMGEVVALDGSPVVGASVTWTALEPDTWRLYEPPTPAERLAIAAKTLQVTSDDRGRFGFEQDPRATGEAPSVLWVTAPGFTGVPSLQPGRIAADLRIVLTPQAPREVSVEYESGGPVAGASIEQFGVYPIDNDFSDPLRVAGGYAFQRRSMSQADGTPEPPLVHVEVGEAMVAELDGVTTAPWRETRANKESPVALVLGATFLASGRVTGDTPELSLANATVEAVGWSGNLASPVASTPVRADGSWGPLSVPLVEGLHYSLRLFGAELAEEEFHLDPPRAGVHVRHDFVATTGMRVSVRVMDDTGAPLRAATVAINRGAEGGHLLTRFGLSSAEGLAVISGVRPGYINIAAEASQHVRKELGWTEVDQAPEEPIEIILPRSMPISGTVVFEGEGVQDFTVVWWTGEMLAAGRQRVQDFTGRESGRFELDEVPPETVWLMATAPELARSASTRSDPEEQNREVVLQLQEPSSAKGQVVEAETGLPLDSAVVTLWMNRNQDYIYPAGDEQRVNTQGRFELTGLAPGDNRFVVAAPGRAKYLGVAFGQEGMDLDLGVIALPRTKPLNLTLVWEGDLDTSAYTATLIGTSFEGPIPFQPNGTVTFPDVSPGWTRIVVEGPGGSMRRQIVMLLPDEEWSFEVPVAAGATLELTLLDSSGEGPPKDLGAMAFLPRIRDSAAPGLESWVMVNFDGDGLARVHGMPPGPFAVTVFDSEGRGVVVGDGVMGNSDQRLELTMGGASATILVVDRLGEPVPEAEVFLSTVDSGTSWNTSGVAGSSGLIEFGTLPFERIVIGARHPERGMSVGNAVDLATAPSPITLRLDARDAIHLLLLEGGKPSSGTRVALTAAGTGYLIGDLASDASGRIQWPNVSGSGFDVRVIQPGYWPRRVTVPTATAADPTRVMVYRTSSATLELRSPTGAAVTGHALELEHAGLNEGPSAWAAAGLLDPAALPLVSDSTGQIQLEGFPAGAYRWRSAGEGQAPFAGEFTLAAGGGGSIDLIVP